MFKRLLQCGLMILFLWQLPLPAGEKPALLWVFYQKNYPLNSAVNELDTYGRIRFKSRALHAVSIELYPEMTAEDLSLLPGFHHTEPLRYLHYKTPPASSGRKLSKSTVTIDPFYGYAYDQLTSLGLTAAQNMGITGKGVRIGIIDTGFKSSLSIFDKIREEGRLIAERDFINDDENTEDEISEGETGLLQTHGTGVWSVIGGYEQGKLIGGAFEAEFVLAKTEVIPTETPIEEDYYAAAIEWFDSLNVDIASASLAYLEFDPPYPGYPVSALDGQTTVVARICNWAASRGMIIVNAAGNEGPGPTSLWSPGDSPLVITVGGVDISGNVSPFSGRGPTADGRIKPDVAALAEEVYKVLPSGDISYGTGTSYATPLITSGIALIKQLRPDWDVSELFYLLQKYATQPKNNNTGWGIPDFGTIVRELYQGSLEPFTLKAYPNPASLSITILSPRTSPSQSLTVFDLTGREIWETTIHSFQDSLAFYIPLNRWPAGIYFGRTGGQTIKFIKQ